MSRNLVVILGPTASGKTYIAARLAGDLGGEIISADSRQVYKHMNIGTGKDLNQYVVNGKEIPYHLIDIIEPDKEFNLFEFQKRFYEIFNCLLEKKALPVLVGGTGLYLESVLCGYEMPEAPINNEIRNNLQRKSKQELQEILRSLKPFMHNETDLNDSGRLIRAIEIESARNAKKQNQRKKPKIESVVFGIKWERAVLRQRISKRLEERLEQGMIKEVSDLHSAGLSWERLDSFGLEYRFISQYLQRNISYEEMKTKLNIAINQFAKRQETWFRRMEKKGVLIHWIQNDDYLLLKENVIKLL